METKFGKFHSSITLEEGGNILIVHRLLFHQGNYPKEDNTDFMEMSLHNMQRKS